MLLSRKLPMGWMGNWVKTRIVIMLVVLGLVVPKANAAAHKTTLPWAARFPRRYLPLASTLRRAVDAPSVANEVESSREVKFLIIMGTPFHDGETLGFCLIVEFFKELVRVLVSALAGLGHRERHLTLLMRSCLVEVMLIV